MIDLSWICGLFKGHSPSRHRLYLISCKYGYRPKPELLCRFCSKNRIPVKVKRLSKKIKPYWFTAYRPTLHIVDEIHTLTDDQIYEVLKNGMTRKEKKDD